MYDMETQCDVMNYEIIGESQEQCFLCVRLNICHPICD